MRTILILRLSAMGDVAMTVPVVKAISTQHPDTKIILLTRKTFNPFFDNIERLTIINPDLYGKHKGITGLYKLYKQIKKNYNPDIVFDIHDVLRTKILRTFFKISNKKTFVIDKGRKEKKLLTKKKNKKLKKLKHTTLRYTEVFTKNGIKINVKPQENIKLNIDDNIAKLLTNDKKNIGIAPFAMHNQKQYPIEKTKKLIRLLIDKNYRIFIFGGGKKEKEFAEELETKHNEVISIIGKFKLKDEIALISNLNLMITMDSANMHIAALTGVKIISIWGATHPFAGFEAFTKNENSIIIQRNDLQCRPCSIYGNKSCYKKTMECFDISPETILNACEGALS